MRLHFLAILALLALNTEALAGTIYTAGPNQGPTPQEWTRFISSGSSYSDAFFRADSLGLRAEVTVQNTTFNHGIAFATIDVNDVIISHVSGNNPATATVQFGGHLNGGVTGTQGSASATLSLAVFGFGVTNRNLGFGINDMPVSDWFYTPAAEVPVGVPIRVRAVLGVGVSALPGLSTIDFGDSFLFNPASVLVLESGFTANSASWGLVDNALPIPEPTSLALAALAVPLAAYMLRLRKLAAQAGRRVDGPSRGGFRYEL